MQEERSINIIYDGISMEVSLELRTTIEQIIEYTSSQQFNAQMKNLFIQENRPYKPITIHDTVIFRLNDQSGKPVDKNLRLNTYPPKKRLNFYISVNEITNNKQGSIIQAQNETLLEVVLWDNGRKVDDIFKIEFEKETKFATVGDFKEFLRLKIGNKSKNMLKLQFFDYNDQSITQKPFLKDHIQFKKFAKNLDVKKIFVLPQYDGGKQI